MNWMAMAVISGLLALSQAWADLSPDNWQLQSIPGAGASNTWRFWIDGSDNPRVLSKSITNGDVNWGLLTGTPPQWTLGDTNAVSGINKEGIFVRTAPDKGYFIGVHQNNGLHYLRCLSFAGGDAGASAEAIDLTGAAPANGEPGISRISATVDKDNNLHVAYVKRATASDELLCYARKAPGGAWTGTAVQLNKDYTAQVRGTAITATGLNEAKLYYTLATAQYTTLWKATPKPYNGVLFIIHLAFPASSIDVGVDFPLAAYQDQLAVGVYSDRLYYFTAPTAATRTLRVSAGTSSGAPLQSDIPAVGANPVQPRSIHAAKAPDGKQRVAWYDAEGKCIHYVKPNTEGGYTSGQPVKFTGVGDFPDADLLGFHFTPSGIPSLLCRRSMTQGYVAFPKDDFDLDGNGRKDIFDTAFNSPTAGTTVLPIDPTVKRLKLTFPTIGSSSHTNSSYPGAVVSLQENLKYAIQVSTDMVTWTTLNSSAQVSYTFASTGGNNPNQRRTFTATLNQEAPGTTPARFARLSVTRITLPLY